MHAQLRRRLWLTCTTAFTAPTKHIRLWWPSSVPCLSTECLEAGDGATENQSYTSQLKSKQHCFLCTYHECRSGLRRFGSQTSLQRAYQCHTHRRRRFRQTLLVICRLSVHLTHSGSIHSTTYVRAFTNARSQFCLLIMEIISGAALPSSLSLPTW